MPEPARRLCVVVAGAGYFGRFHLDAWSRMPEVELAGILEPDAVRAAPLAAEYGAPGGALPVFADPGEMVAALAPDLVDIAAPPAAHLALIRALAPRVPRLICQKPFCGGTAAAREAIAVARAHGARLAVHENIRFRPIPLKKVPVDRAPSR